MDSAEPARDFIPYPTNRVVGTVADAPSARAAIEELVRAGFGQDDIEMLHGEDDIRRLDPTGADHGFLARFQRTVLRTAAAAEEFRYLTHHVDDIRAGRYVIMVRVPDRDRRVRAADVLNAHGAEFVAFYGRWVWEGLNPDEAAGGNVGDAPKLAEDPSELPALFADAWNRRDPDGLAALFDEDAEFVNVTGLWWHDRHAIRKAHAYGLSRIFNTSTLHVDEVRVKTLSDRVAVVHARMTLSGQTPVGSIERPQPRTTIFSFVVHWQDNWWRCASAQNTDVIPEMETNVVDAAGRFHSANYREGRVV